jgi:MipA family protein
MPFLYQLAGSAGMRDHAPMRAKWPGIGLWCFLGWSAAAGAAELPLWEAGLGIAPVSFPEYRGSDSQRHFVLPFPYLLYRGDQFQVDRGGIRGLLLERPGFDIDVSLDGAVPVTSGDDGPRTGMPDLDAVVETGPSLNWLAWEGDPGRLRLRLPVRAAIATDLRSLRHVGWAAHPQLHAETADRPGAWSISVALGPLFADRAYHDFYYSVPPEFASPERPAYQARGGYSGVRLIASASRRMDRAWVGAFLRYENMSGARITGSPLVETRHAVMAGFGVAWILRQSSRPAAPGW